MNSNRIINSIKTIKINFSISENKENILNILKENYTNKTIVEENYKNLSCSNDKIKDYIIIQENEDLSSMENTKFDFKINTENILNNISEKLENKESNEKKDNPISLNKNNIKLIKKVNKKKSISMDLNNEISSLLKHKLKLEDEQKNIKSKEKKRNKEILDGIKKINIHTNSINYKGKLIVFH